MFGMIVGADLKLLESVSMNRRNIVVIALSLGIGLGLKAVPESVKLVPESLQMLRTSGLLPSAILAVVLNIILPEEQT